MGTYYGWKTRSEMLRELRGQESRGKIIASKVVGSQHWYVLERDGKRLIGLDLLSQSRKEHGYKPMDESMHPYYYNCPAKFLDLAQPMLCDNRYALEWRQKVRDLDLENKSKGSQKRLGDVVEYNGLRYRLIGYLGRKGWDAYRLDDNLVYRMKAHQAKDAELVQPQQQEK